MTKMTSTEEKLCYDAVRYYQMNHVGPFKHAQYAMCDCYVHEGGSSTNMQLRQMVFVIQSRGLWGQTPVEGTGNLEKYKREIKSRG